MLLVLDIGNSNVVAGVYAGTTLRRSWRFASTTQKTSDEYGVLLEDFFKQSGLKPSGVDAAILASVVPPLVPVFEEAIRRLRDILSMDADDAESLQILAVANELAAGDLAKKQTLPVSQASH